MRNCRGLATTLAGVVTMAAAGAVAWLATAGATMAGAATRSRASGLPTHAHAGAGFSSSGVAGSQLAGPDIMALVVAGLAVSSFIFLIVTFVRRRTSTA